MPHRTFPAKRTAGTGFGTCGLWKPRIRHLRIRAFRCGGISFFCQIRHARAHAAGSGADAASRFSGKADCGNRLWDVRSVEVPCSASPHKGFPMRRNFGFFVRFVMSGRMQPDRGQMPHRAFPARRTAGTGFGTCGLWKPHDPEFSAAVPPGRMLRAASQGFRVRFVCFAPSCRKSVSGVCRSRGLCLRGLCLRGLLLRRAAAPGGRPPPKIGKRREKNRKEAVRVIGYQSAASRHSAAPTGFRL